MSEHEKFAWASLVASAAVWAFFGMRLTDGGQVVNVGVSHLVWTYGATVVLMAATHSVIAAVLARRPHGIAFKDERDHAIAARADRVEGYVVLVAINVLGLLLCVYAGVFLAILEHYIEGFFGRFHVRADPFTRSVFYFVVLILAIWHSLLFYFALVGVLDSWFDFRGLERVGDGR